MYYTIATIPVPNSSSLYTKSDHEIIMLLSSLRTKTFHVALHHCTSATVYPYSKQELSLQRLPPTRQHIPLMPVPAPTYCNSTAILTSTDPGRNDLIRYSTVLSWARQRQLRLPELQNTKSRTHTHRNKRT
jgi:hypothetical protein